MRGEERARLTEKCSRFLRHRQKFAYFRLRPHKNFGLLSGAGALVNRTLFVSHTHVDITGGPE